LLTSNNSNKLNILGKQHNLNISTNIQTDDKNNMLNNLIAFHYYIICSLLHCFDTVSWAAGHPECKTLSGGMLAWLSGMR